MKNWKEFLKWEADIELSPSFLKVRSSFFFSRPSDITDLWHHRRTSGLNDEERLFLSGAIFASRFTNAYIIKSKPTIFRWRGLRLSEAKWVFFESEKQNSVLSAHTREKLCFVAWWCLSLLLCDIRRRTLVLKVVCVAGVGREKERFWEDEMN